MEVVGTSRALVPLGRGAYRFRSSQNCDTAARNETNGLLTRVEKRCNNYKVTLGKLKASLAWKQLTTDERTFVRNNYSNPKQRDRVNQILARAESKATATENLNAHRKSQ